jgi:hypothetical protein
MMSEDSVSACSERIFEDLKRQMNALTNLSKICSWNSWYHSLILSEDITILAIYSNGVDLGKKKEVRKPEEKRRKQIEIQRWIPFVHVLYISFQVCLQISQWFQKLEYGTDDNPETIDSWWSLKLENRPSLRHIHDTM